MRIRLDDFATLRARLPVELERSRAFVVDHTRILRFAEATEDRQWIHVDPVRATDGPFGSTIAHGFLTLSLLSAALEDMLQVEEALTVINYGLNRVRFPCPVPEGSRVFASGELADVQLIAGGYQVTLDAALWVDTADRPACVAEWLIRYQGSRHD